jgi:nucleotide-binding universal stress UspA family protein
MQTILVPTDFSATARNAARYAIALAEQFKAKKIILYNAYQVPVSTDPTMPTLQLFTLEDIKKVSEEGLAHFKGELLPFVKEGIALETISEFNVLEEGIEELTERTQTDVIVMGITGGDKVEEVLIGSNTISVAKHAKVPVIIVPAGCSFSPIKEVVLACDFKKVVETTPVQPIKDLLDQTGARLFVLNVGNEKQPVSADASFESLMLDTLLEGYHPQYHFLESKDFTEAINQFAQLHQVDLIITIPKKHGWFDGLFKRSHTKMLAFHSHVPLMIVHE